MKKIFLIGLAALCSFNFTTYAVRHNAVGSAVCENFEDKLVVGAEFENVTVNITEDAYKSNYALQVKKDAADSAICERIFMKKDCVYEISAWIKGTPKITLSANGEDFKTVDCDGEWYELKAEYTHETADGDVDIKLFSDREYIIDDLTVVPSLKTVTEEDVESTVYEFDENIGSAEKYGEETNDISYAAGEGHKKNGALKITKTRKGKQAAVSLPVKIKKGIGYEVAVWVKVASDASEDWIFSAEIDGKKAETTVSYGYDGYGEWKKLSLEFTADSDAENIVVSGVCINTGKKSFYADDVSVVPNVIHSQNKITNIYEKNGVLTVKTNNGEDTYGVFYRIVNGGVKLSGITNGDTISYNTQKSDIGTATKIIAVWLDTDGYPMCKQEADIRLKGDYVLKNEKDGDTAYNVTIRSDAEQKLGTLYLAGYDDGMLAELVTAAADADETEKNVRVALNENHNEIKLFAFDDNISPVPWSNGAAQTEEILPQKSYEEIINGVTFREHEFDNPYRFVTADISYDGNSRDKTAVEELYKIGAINLENNTFVTSAKVLKIDALKTIMIAAKIPKSPYVGVFNDVSGLSENEKSYVQGAYNAGIISHTESFEPSKNITGEELSAILAAVAERKGAVSSVSLSGIVTNDILARNVYKLCYDVLKNTKGATDVPQIYETEKSKTAGGVPHIFKTSDKVEEGGYAAIYGEGFENEVYLQKVTDRSADISNAVKAETVIGDSQNITFVLPESAAYYVWAKNSAGISTPNVINAARPLWISEESFGLGQQITIAGRNFIEENTSAVLTNGTEAYKLIITESSPYSITAEVPYDTKPGTYSIAVSNDGIIWKTPEDGKTVEIKDEISDPMNLGVGWADKFNYDKIYNVTEKYGGTSLGWFKKDGALGDGTTNDKTAIEHYISEASANGGGIVYFPKPKDAYLISGSLTVPANVILVGETRDTAIRYTNVSETGYVFNMMNDGKSGLFRLTLENGDESAPDINIFMGNEWHDSPCVLENLDCDYMFLKDVNLKTTYERKEKSSGGYIRNHGLAVGMRDHFLMQGCNFTGFCAGFEDSRMRNYVNVCDNDIRTAFSSVNITAEYALIKNNYKENFDRTAVMTYLNNDTSGCGIRQGFFIKGLTQIENNIILGAGSGANDGEVIAVEDWLAGEMMVGSVTDVSTDGKTLTLSPRYKTEDGVERIWGGRSGFTPWDITKRVVGNFEVLITEGTGLGQMRKISAMSETEKTLTVDREWDIIPDNTSKFIVWVPAGKWVNICNNYANDADKGYWFYRGTYDSTMANNISENAQGFEALSMLTDYTGMESYDTSYFITLENNEVIGGANTANEGGVIISAGVHSGEENGLLTYGGVIRDNLVRDNDKYSKGVHYGECAAFPASGVCSTFIDTFATGMRPKVSGTLQKGFIIENNRSENTQGGIILGKTDYKRYNSTPVSDWPKTADIIAAKGNTVYNVRVPYIINNTENYVVKP